MVYLNIAWYAVSTDSVSDWSVAKAPI